MNTQLLLPEVNRETLRNDIAKVTNLAWPQFAGEHPALAQVIAHAMLGEYLTQSLADDARFTASYDAALEANVGPRALANLVDEFVRPALRRLL